MTEREELKRYRVTPRWFDGRVFEAPSPAKAKAKAYIACKEALGRNITFRDFLDGLHITPLGRVCRMEQEG